MQIKTLRDSHEELLKRTSEQHEQDLQNMQEKYTSLLKLEQRERDSSQELFS
jgi:ElaB/YqjD/DUF883 family membrane-anchored ribosome-binding protein